MNQLTPKVEVIDVVHSGTDGNDCLVGVQYLALVSAELDAVSRVGHSAHADHVPAAGIVFNVSKYPAVITNCNEHVQNTFQKYFNTNYKLRFQIVFHILVSITFEK